MSGFPIMLSITNSFCSSGSFVMIQGESIFFFKFHYFVLLQLAHTIQCPCLWSRLCPRATPALQACAFPQRTQTVCKVDNGLFGSLKHSTVHAPTVSLSEVGKGIYVESTRVSHDMELLDWLISEVQGV